MQNEKGISVDPLIQPLIDLIDKNRETVERILSTLNQILENIKQDPGLVERMDMQTRKDISNELAVLDKIITRAVKDIKLAMDQLSKK